MSFKQKNRKKISYDNRVTLDAKHNDKIKEMTLKKQNIEKNKKNLGELKKHKLLSMKNRDLDSNQLEEKLSIIDKINQLENDINKFSAKNDEVNYLLNTGNLLFSYYENISNVADGVKTYTKQKKKEGTKKSVMEFFIKPENKSKNCEENKNDKSSKSTIKYKSRANIYDEYLYETEEDYVQNEEDKSDVCEECNVERITYLSEGYMVCPVCGNQEYILIDSDKPSYKDPPREVSYFAYKRINHFNEWLAQFQAKESTDIPQEVYDQILVELKKERIENMVELSPQKLREILKKLKKNKYYEHVPHIINRLNGVPPPIMSLEKEEELRRMFKEIQIPFHKFCPKARKNFLSYSYVLHKFVQLLELDEFLPCFMLLKSREKLHQQDLIWKQICDYLKWEFIPSL